MKYLPQFSIFMLSLVFATTTQAQDKEFKGTLKEKSWAKSTQSYCAQGSNYLVLVESNGKEHILDLADNGSVEDYQAWNGKAVRVKGEISSRSITPTYDPMEQRPIMYGPDGKEIQTVYTCTVLTVSSISPNKTNSVNSPSPVPQQRINTKG